jgi:hypothetical protein
VSGSCRARWRIVVLGADALDRVGEDVGQRAQEVELLGREDRSARDWAHSRPKGPGSPGTWTATPLRTPALRNASGMRKRRSCDQSSTMRAPPVGGERRQVGELPDARVTVGLGQAVGAALAGSALDRVELEHVGHLDVEHVADRGRDLVDELLEVAALERLHPEARDGGLLRGVAAELGLRGPQALAGVVERAGGRLDLALEQRVAVGHQAHLVARADGHVDRVDAGVGAVEVAAGRARASRG